MSTQSYKYKTQAESRIDVDRALIWLRHKGHEPSFSIVQMIGFKGRELYTLTSDLNYQEVTKLLISAPFEDLHVLIESLKPFKEFDTERNNPFTMYY